MADTEQSLFINELKKPDIDIDFLQKLLESGKIRFPIVSPDFSNGSIFLQIVFYRIVNDNIGDDSITNLYDLFGLFIEYNVETNILLESQPIPLVNILYFLSNPELFYYTEPKDVEIFTFFCFNMVCLYLLFYLDDTENDEYIRVILKKEPNNYMKTFFKKYDTRGASSIVDVLCKNQNFFMPHLNNNPDIIHDIFHKMQNLCHPVTHTTAENVQDMMHPTKPMNRELRGIISNMEEANPVPTTIATSPVSPFPNYEMEVYNHTTGQWEIPEDRIHYKNPEPALYSPDENLQHVRQDRTSPSVMASSDILNQMRNRDSLDWFIDRNGREPREELDNSVSSSGSSTVISPPQNRRRTHAMISEDDSPEINRGMVREEFDNSISSSSSISPNQRRTNSMVYPERNRRIVTPPTRERQEPPPLQRTRRSPSIGGKKRMKKTRKQK